MSSRLVNAAFFIFLVGLPSLLLTGSVKSQDEVDFAHDILPILKSRCASCHSNGVYKGGFSLDSRDQLLESGFVEPGSSLESDVVDRITSDDPDYQMPPDGERLSQDEVDRISAWIDEGLVWPKELGLKQSTNRRPLSLRVVELPVSESTHPIDRLLESYFSANEISVPQRLTDEQFLRRAKLDLLGLLPTQEELSEFSQRAGDNKRTLLVKELLDRNQDYADHWMSFWNDLLRNDYVGTGYIDGGRKQITNWLYKSLKANKPYDQFVAELVAPTAESDGFVKGIKWRGRVNASQIEPLQFSQNISQVFLGINMKCASCHDSFIDDWKLEDAYGLAAIISDKPLELHRCDVGTGKTATSQFVFPSLGAIDQAKPQQQRLEQLSLLMTSPQNGRFLRTIVNRLWHRMMGRGLVDPVDVMAGEAWSEDLLDFLANDLVSNGFDLKQTMQLIATSKIYQSASVPVPGIKSNGVYVFQGVIAKRMTAEQFVDSIWQVTMAGPKKIDAKIDLFVPDEKAVGNQQNSEEGGKGAGPVLTAKFRASLMLADPLMRSLGRPNREQVVTTRPAELSTLQALDLSNGKILVNWLREGAKYWIKKKSESNWTDEKLIEEIFLTALSRLPTDSEKASLELEQGDLQSSVEDLLWIVTMLPEFQFVQ